jgi:TRAP-type mannitol/chloroaromatic compound transport system permease small subunit
VLNTDAKKISEILPRTESLPETQGSLAIDRALAKMASAMSWVWLLLMLVIVLNVTMRYVFGQGRIEFEEIQWHLYAIGFLAGLASCMSANNHIRVDVFHAGLSLRLQAWIELYGLLLLFFPFVLMVLVFSIPFVEYSWRISEVSDAPGGLPFRWIIKSALPAGMCLLLLAGLRRLLRVCAYLFGAPRPLDIPGNTHVD